jgi:hypothetical protein
MDRHHLEQIAHLFAPAQPLARSRDLFSTVRMPLGQRSGSRGNAVPLEPFALANHGRRCDAID